MNKIIIVAILVILLVALPVEASDISSAEYLTKIAVSNNSTSAKTGICVPFSCDTATMIAGGMLNAGATDLAMRSNAGNDVAVMPGWGGNPWVLYAPILEASQNTLYNLYTGGVTGGEIRYFPGAGGMTIPDDDSLELGDEFQWLIIDWCGDTTAGSGGYLIYKDGACSLSVSDTVTGTITFAIVGGASVSATSIPSGEYDIEVTANVTHLMIYINSVLKDTATMTASVPANSDNWTFFSGGSTKYVGSIILNN